MGGGFIWEQFYLWKCLRVLAKLPSLVHVHILKQFSVICDYPKGSLSCYPDSCSCWVGKTFIFIFFIFYFFSPLFCQIYTNLSWKSVDQTFFYSVLQGLPKYLTVCEYYYALIFIHAFK